MAAMTLAEVETKINALLTTPEVDYTVGDKKFSNSQKLKQLMAYREHLLKHPTASVDTLHFDLGISEFGQERSEYED